MSTAQPSESTSLPVARIVVGLVAILAIVGLAIWFALPLLRSGPGRAAQEFLAAVAQRDLAAARARATEGGGHLEDSELEAILQQGATFDIGEVRKMGNTANVRYSSEGGDEELMVLLLEDGQWRVTETGGHDLSAPFTRPLSQEETVARDFLAAIVAGDADGARKLLTAGGQQTGDALLADHIAYWETRKQSAGALVPTPHVRRGDGDEISVRGRYESPNFGVSNSDQTGGGGRGGGGGGGGLPGGGAGGRGGEPPLGGGAGFDVNLRKENDQWRVRSVVNHPPEGGQGNILTDEDIAERSRVWDYENPDS